MSYLEHENFYSELMRGFLQGAVSTNAFVKRFMDQWRADRDAQWKSIDSGNEIPAAENELGEVLDRVFTACDVYSPYPENQYEISESEFREEVTRLFEERWGSTR